MRKLVWMLLLYVAGAMMACALPRPQPTAMPTVTPFVSPLPAAAEQCAPRRDAVWRTWRTASSPLAVYALLMHGDSLWVGTSFGVWRVNPATGQYESNEEMGQVRFFLPVGNGQLWVVAARGLYFFDGYSWQRFPSPSDLNAFSVYQAAVNRDEELWVWRSVGRFGAPLFLPDHLPSAQLTWQSKDLDWSQWDLTNCQHWQIAATYDYVYRSPAECEALNVARLAVRSLTDKYATPKLAIDADRSVWWALQKKLGHLAGGRSTTQELPVSWITALAPDPVHGVWIGTDQGLAYSDGDDLRWVSLGLDVCAFVGMPRDLTVDAQQVTWVAADNQVYTLAPHGLTWMPFTDLLRGEKSAAGPVVALTAAPIEGVWATHGYDLWQFGGAQSFKPLQAPGGCFIERLVLDSVGNIWVAANPCGVLQFIPSERGGRWIEHSRLGASNLVRAVAASGNKIFALTSDGLFEHTRAMTYTFPAGPFASPIPLPEWHLVVPMTSLITDTGRHVWPDLALAADRQNNVWIAWRQTGQLWRYRAGELTSLGQPFDPGGVGLYVDRQDRLWASVNDMLAVYDGQRWRHIPAPVGAIRKLVDGPDGRLWVLGDGGIAVYNPAADPRP